MLRILILLASLSYLFGCASVPQTVQISPTTCLPMTTYTLQQETDVANELDKLPKDSNLRLFINDYATLRAENRACLK